MNKKLNLFLSRGYEHVWSSEMEQSLPKHKNLLFHLMSQPTYPDIYST